MPVEFLTDEQADRYGRFAGDPTPEQLTQFFVLSEADRTLIAQRRRAETRLGFAVQMGTLRFLGTFLADPQDTPPLVVAHVAQQLQLPQQAFKHYALRAATRHQHRQIVTQHLGYREFGDVQAFRLIRWLYAQLALGAPRPSILFDLTTAYLTSQKIVLPGVTTLARLIVRVRERYTARTFSGLSQRLSPEQRAALDQLLILRDGRWQTPLEELRTPPGRVSALALHQAIHRIERIRAIGVSDLNLSDVPASRQAGLVRHARTVRAQSLERLGEDRRLATLLVFIQHLERTATDDVLDLFAGVMNDLGLRGEARRRRERWRSLKDLDQAALLLREAALILLDPSIPADQVRARAWQRVGEGHLLQAAGKVAELARPDEDTTPEALQTSYASIRRFLRGFLIAVNFSGTPGARPLLEALAFLKHMDEPGGGKPKWTEAPRGFVPKSWERHVMPERGVVDHQAYTLCAAERLHHALRRREVFVERSERFGDPRAELLHGQAWLDVREDVGRALGRSLDARAELELLRLELDRTYREVGARVPENQAFSVTVQGGQTQLSLAAPIAIEEPSSLVTLRREVLARLPVVDLPELLMEVHALTGFADAFTHVAEGKSTVRDLPLSVCAVLLAQACNIGLKAVARPDDLAPVSGASLIANPAANLEAHERQTVHRTTDPGHPRPA